MDPSGDVWDTELDQNSWTERRPEHSLSSSYRDLCSGDQGPGPLLPDINQSLNAAAQGRGCDLGTGSFHCPTASSGEGLH